MNQINKDRDIWVWKRLNAFATNFNNEEYTSNSTNGPERNCINTFKKHSEGVGYHGCLLWKHSITVKCKKIYLYLFKHNMCH